MPADSPALSLSEQWQSGTLSKDLSFLLARVTADFVSAGNRALKDLGLNVRLYSALSLVCEGHQPTQRDLADFLRLDPSQVVPLIDELESQGLVERRTDPRDRRSNVVQQTEAGEAMRRTARTAVEEAQREDKAALGAGRADELVHLLRLLAFRADR